MPKRKAPPQSAETPVKATDAEIVRRVATVHKLMVAGASRASIQQYAANQWGLSERPVDEYISRAKETLKEQVDRDKDHNLEMALARMQEIYQECKSAKNYKGAIQAQVEINKLLGLYAPVNANVNLSGSVAIKSYANFSPDDWSDADEPTATED
jgi:hypothetical protein